MKKIVLLTCLLSTAAIAENTQEIWSGIGGNPAHTGYVNTTSDASKFKQLWQKQFVDPEPASNSGSLFYMSITSDLLYVSTSDHDKYQGIYAVNLNTGDIVWKQTIPANIDYVSAPAYGNGLVYYIETRAIDKANDNFGYIVAFDALTGKPAFSTQASLYSLDAFAGPLFYDNQLYVLDSPHVYAINPANGNINYFSILHGRDRQPIITKDYLIRSYKNELQITNRLTGMLDYSIPTPLSNNSDSFYINHIYDDNANLAFGVYFDFTAQQTLLYAFDIKQHAIKWSYPMTGYTHQPAIASNIIYIVDNEVLNAIDANNGKLLWHWNIDAKSTDMPEYQQSYIPVITNNHVIISGRGYTYAINRATHNKDWEMQISGHLALGLHALYIEDDRYNGPVTAISIN